MSFQGGNRAGAEVSQHVGVRTDGVLTCPPSGKELRSGHHQPGMSSNKSSRTVCAGGPPVNVVEWRRCRLLESGFGPALADRLASTPDIDVHALLALVDRGCPPDLAARILSPVGAP
jgi:hypothetical protein